MLRSTNTKHRQWYLKMRQEDMKLLQKIASSWLLHLFHHCSFATKGRKVFFKEFAVVYCMSRRINDWSSEECFILKLCLPIWLVNLLSSQKRTHSSPYSILGYPPKLLKGRINSEKDRSEGRKTRILTTQNTIYTCLPN